MNRFNLKYNIKDLEERRKKLRNNMTHAEVILWNYIRRKQIHNVRFRRQFSIDKFIVDFYSPKLLLAIEVDGLTHQTEEEIKYDEFRQNALEANGITFLRFTNTEVYDNIDGIVKVISFEVEGLLKKKSLK